MRVLVIEDEKKIAALLKQGLTENGYKVDNACYATEAQQLISTFDYDIILMDIMLPGISGLELLQKFREENKETPVILITGLDSIEDRVKGLSLGADDYIVKPFAFVELLERMNTVLRRSSYTTENPVIHVVGDLVVDTLRRTVTRGGKRIDLVKKEYELLSILIRNREQGPISKNRIAERIWGITHTEAIVEDKIRRLRAKIDAPFEKKLLHTIKGSGYILEDRG